MSTLLEQASLVLIPSGYKEDVVYSQIPTNGSGDLSFTRASNGTRINSAGLVEVCPWNLLNYSEDFSNAVWNKYQSAITANATTAPNGTTTADKLEYTTTGTAVLFATSSALQNQVYALSCYAKQGATNILQIGFTLSGGDKIANFNLNTGVITTTSSGVTASIESVGDGWYRCIMSLTTDINTPNVFINSTSGTTGNYIYIWGAQLNIGSTAKPYFPTTDRLNVPRLTYQNGGGGCPSLLLEKQSTNLLTYSQNLTGASWTTVANTLTANYATSPDGTSNATRIIPNTANSTHINYQTFTVSSATSITAFAKADGYNFFQIYGGDASGGPLRYSVVVNLTTGAIDTIDTITSNQVAIVSMGNGWYKITISNFTSFTSGFSFIGIAGIPSSGLSRNANLDVIFAGNGTGGVLAYGIQVEESTYPTSYIPTTSASATRVADACLKTGISSLIGQTEGVLFVDMIKSQSGYNYYNLSDGTNNNRIFIGQDADSPDRLRAYVRASGATASVDINVGPVANGRYKMAIGYKLNDVVFYINGTLSGTDTNTVMPTGLSDLSLTNGTGGVCDLTNNVNQVALFKTRLTNAELASLTTI